ncbi:Fe-S cluster assembly protein SufD, partial [Lacticaseibacillus rhamnosus]
MARHEVETTLSEKKAECLMEGLYLARGKQHVDIRTFVDHMAPACKSEEVFKGILDNEAVGIFDGRILVRENA